MVHVDSYHLVFTAAATAVVGPVTEVLDAATKLEVGFRVAPSVAGTAVEGIETEVLDAVIGPKVGF